MRDRRAFIGSLGALVGLATHSVAASRPESTQGKGGHRCLQGESQQIDAGLQRLERDQQALSQLAERVESTRS